MWRSEDTTGSMWSRRSGGWIWEAGDAQWTQRLGGSWIWILTDWVYFYSMIKVNTKYIKLTINDSAQLWDTVLITTVYFQMYTGHIYRILMPLCRSITSLDTNYMKRLLMTFPLKHPLEQLKTTVIHIYYP